ncbi:hypothetical protein SH139x_003605 [Planctomycetaceae bacterium SH139]
MGARSASGTWKNLAGFRPVVLRLTVKVDGKKKLRQNLVGVALNKLVESGIFMASARGVAQPG